MAGKSTVTLEFFCSKKDIRDMAKSLKKVHQDPTDCDAKDANALLYCADLMNEIATNMQKV